MLVYIGVKYWQPKFPEPTKARRRCSMYFQLPFQKKFHTPIERFVSDREGRASKTLLRVAGISLAPWIRKEPSHFMYNLYRILCI
jgi:hypothetical protein